MDESTHGGLYGALSILGPDERPPDREFVVFFETQLDFMTINGRAFVGNTPVFHARVGETVQWYLLSHGDDFHTLPRPRPPLARPLRSGDRHEDRRAGRELLSPLEGG